MTVGQAKNGVKACCLACFPLAGCLKGDAVLDDLLGGEDERRLREEGREGLTTAMRRLAVGRRQRQLSGAAFDGGESSTASTGGSLDLVDDEDGDVDVREVVDRRRAHGLRTGNYRITVGSSSCAEDDECGSSSRGATSSGLPRGNKADTGWDSDDVNNSSHNNNNNDDYGNNNKNIANNKSSSSSSSDDEDDDYDDENSLTPMTASRPHRNAATASREWRQEKVNAWEDGGAPSPGVAGFCPNDSIGALSSAFDCSYGSEAGMPPDCRSPRSTSPPLTIPDADFDPRSVSFLPGSMLGKGSFGSVHKARVNGKLLAVKVLRNMVDDRCESVTRYMSENVMHPNLVQIFGVKTVKMNYTIDFGSPLPGLRNGRESYASGCPSPSPSMNVAGEITPHRDTIGAMTPKTELSTASDMFSDLARTLPNKNGALEDFETWILMEYCNMGCLKHAIQRGVFHENGVFTRPQLLHILLAAVEIATGMMYLHGSGIVHGDLKPENILLQRKREDSSIGLGFDCKIGDFGLSRVLKVHSTHVDTFSCGTLTHMAPEVLRDGVVSLAGDVFSFGILLWELLTGEKPFNGMPQTNILVSIVEGRRPAVPAYAPTWYRHLIQDCWHQDRKSRPQFSEIVDRIRLMIVMLEKPQVDPVFATISSSVSEKIVAFAGTHFSPFMDGDLHNNPFYDASADEMASPAGGAPQPERGRRDSLSEDDSGEVRVPQAGLIGLTRANTDPSLCDKECTAMVNRLVEMDPAFEPGKDQVAPPSPGSCSTLNPAPRKPMKVSINCTEQLFLSEPACIPSRCWPTESIEGTPCKENVCNQGGPSKKTTTQHSTSQETSGSKLSGRSSNSSTCSHYSCSCADNIKCMPPLPDQAAVNPSSRQTMQPKCGAEAPVRPQQRLSPWDWLSSSVLNSGSLTPMSLKSLQSSAISMGWSSSRPTNKSNPTSVKTSDWLSGGGPDTYTSISPKSAYSTVTGFDSCRSNACSTTDTGFDSCRTTGYSTVSGLDSCRISVCTTVTTGFDTCRTSGTGLLPVMVREVGDEPPMRLNEMSNCVLSEPIFAAQTGV